MIGPWWTLVISVGLAAAVVLSLYVWSDSTRLSRDDPIQIKRRLLSSGLVTLASPLTVYFGVVQVSPCKLFIDLTIEAFHNSQR